MWGSTKVVAVNGLLPPTLPPDWLCVLIALENQIPHPNSGCCCFSTLQFSLQIQTHMAHQLVDTASSNAPTASEQSQDTSPSAYSVRSCRAHSAMLYSYVGLDYWYTTVYINYPGLLDMPRYSAFFKDADINEHMPLSFSDDLLGQKP